jgi:hypothetical protein
VFSAKKKRRLVTSPVPDVEKGTNTVISANFGVFVERKINELQIEFLTRRERIAAQCNKTTIGGATPAA